MVGEFADLTEVLDLAASKKCRSPMNSYDAQTMDGTGLLIGDKYPLICEGYVRSSSLNDRLTAESNTCTLFTPYRGNKVANLQTSR